MTSEILIMNKNCVALAADSASTVWRRDNPKIFSADKIFSLSGRHPVGIMTYNVSEISGVPIDVLVKEFRSSLGDASFSSVEEYAESFFRFINTGQAVGTVRKRSPMIPSDLADQEVAFLIAGLWREMRLNADKLMNKILNNHLEGTVIDRNMLGDISRDSMRSVVAEMIGGCTVDLGTKRSRSIMKKISEVLDDSYVDYLDSGSKYDLEEHLEPLIKILADRVISLNGLEHYTGLVFAGYGEKELFPSFVEYKVYGYLFGELRHKKIDEKSICAGLPSWIEPFAQGDVAETFLFGMSAELENELLCGFEDALDDATSAIVRDLDGNDLYRGQIKKSNEKMMADLRTDINEYLEKKYLWPTETMVRFLSKDELASMAESLINITSLRRRVSDDVETVGGPVDVAVISRGEGLKWIKRKQYFDEELNHYNTDAYKEN